MSHDQFALHEAPLEQSQPLFLQPNVVTHPRAANQPSDPISTVDSTVPASTYATAPLAPASRWWDAGQDCSTISNQPFEPPPASVASNNAFFNVFRDTTAAQPSTSVVPFTAPTASVLSPTQLLNLPSGQCNFVDLAPGASGARCGCRRFYSSCDLLKAEPTEFCMCLHHACFHDHSPPESTAAVAAHQLDTPNSNIPPPPLHSQSPHLQPPNLLAKTPRIAPSPLQDISARFSPALANSSPFHFDRDSSQHPFAPRSAPIPLPLPPTSASNPAPPTSAEQTTPAPPPTAVPAATRDSKAQPASIPDTLSWAGSGPSPSSGPKNDSTSTNPASVRPVSSQNSSTTTSSRFLLPFGGKGVHLIRGLGAKSREPLRDRSNNQDFVGPEQRPKSQPGKLPKDHTPCDSMATTCSDSEGSELAQHSCQNCRRTSTTVVTVGRKVRKGPPDVASTNIDFKGFTDMVNSHENRIDRLENVSIITSIHEECNERHESLDLRVYDLETRVEDVEKMVHDSSFKRAQDPHGSNPDGYDHAELVGQIQALQAQVSQLQKAAPSVWHPWEVEVVFLPFALRKIWLPSHEFKADSPSGSLTDTDSWTRQLPTTHFASSSNRPQSPFVQEWRYGEEDVHEWLLPRAYRIDSLLDKRLRSRGCIRRISVQGPDARAVQIAINTSFTSLLGNISARRHMLPSTTRPPKFMGLQQDWVPLRKIHKDSRLRFLTPAEMITPATWNVAFLNSVLMKSSQPRLFITQPEAYVQDDNAFDLSWNWQHLRELSRVSSEDVDSQEVGEADALEECWAWNDLLDEPHSASSKHWLQEAPFSPPQHSNLLQPHAPRRVSNPFAIKRPPTPTRVCKSMVRPGHTRTTSMPLARHSPSYSFPAASAASENRRRLMSHDGRPQSSGRSSFVRRRSVRSPSNKAQPTPRWSSGPPSPGPSATALPTPNLMRAVSNASSKASSATAFNYATPHSNPIAPADMATDTDAETDIEDRAGAGANHADGHDGDTFMTEDDISINGGNNNLLQIDLRRSFQNHAPFCNDDDDDDDDMSFHAQHQRHLLASDSPASWHQMPEDEPWPGIEDHLSTPSGDGDGNARTGSAGSRRCGSGRNSDGGNGSRSDSSSQPSEYPSTHPHGHDVFHIHEDDDEDENMTL
ncbi:hypothetical protein BROUX41_000288 [Berkeleyomyces rouxiae]